MCGRFALNAVPQDLMDVFGAVKSAPFSPRFNIAPTAEIPVVLEREAEEPREVRLMRWGLIPHWAKEASMGAKLNNARAETVAEKPSFRNAIRRRRCIIPASGFYEWKVLDARTKQPYFISAREQRFIAMAGLWEYWRAPAGEGIVSCCVITTNANLLMEPIHDRMPVILPSGAWNRWLDPDLHSFDAVADLLVPAKDGVLQAWPVAREVGRSTSEGESLTAPLPGRASHSGVEQS